MSPRPPLKISLRHDWTKESGSKGDRPQKRKLLDNQKLLNKQDSSNQPNQFQIQFVIDQGDLVSRKTWSVFKMKERPVLKISVWILQRRTLFFR